jgi:hypothetical protein
VIEHVVVSLGTLQKGKRVLAVPHTQFGDPPAREVFAISGSARERLRNVLPILLTGRLFEVADRALRA